MKKWRVRRAWQAKNEAGKFVEVHAKEWSGSCDTSWLAHTMACRDGLDAEVCPVPFERTETTITEVTE